MSAPVYQLAAADLDVMAVIGEGGKPRLYGFGDAPQGIGKPYAVWQLVGGTPENLLAGIPNMDNYTVQVDAYSSTGEAEARTLGLALRGAFEPHGYVTSYNFEGREPETRLYRYSFTVEFMVPRDTNS